MENFQAGDTMAPITRDDEIFIKKGNRLTRVRIWHSYYVMGIQTFYEGESHGPIIGADLTPSLEVSDLVLDDGEQIIGVYGRACGWMDQIIIVTNCGKRMTCGRSSGGFEFSFQKIDHYVSSFSYGVGDHLNFIKLNFSKVLGAAPDTITIKEIQAKKYFDPSPSLIPFVYMTKKIGGDYENSLYFDDYSDKVFGMIQNGYIPSISCVEVWSDPVGKKLYGIKILYKFDPINKTEKEEFYEAKHVCSGKGSYVVDKFNINPDERINGISGTHHNIIDSIRIMTSTENKILEVGQKGEYYFEFMIPPTSKVPYYSESSLV